MPSAATMNGNGGMHERLCAALKCHVPPPPINVVPASAANDPAGGSALRTAGVLLTLLLLLAWLRVAYRLLCLTMQQAEMQAPPAGNASRRSERRSQRAETDPAAGGKKAKKRSSRKTDRGHYGFERPTDERRDAERRLAARKRHRSAATAQPPPQQRAQHEPEVETNRVIMRPMTQPVRPSVFVGPYGHSKPTKGGWGGRSSPARKHGPAGGVVTGSERPSERTQDNDTADAPVGESAPPMPGAQQPDASRRMQVIRLAADATAEGNDAGAPPTPPPDEYDYDEAGGRRPPWEGEPAGMPVATVSASGASIGAPDSVYGVRRCIEAAALSDNRDQLDCADCKHLPFTPVTFRWTHGGKLVFLSASFFNWTQLSQMEYCPAAGAHVITVTLPRGHHEFKFWVDREWRLDSTHALAQCSNRLGGINHVIHVP